MMRLTLLSTLAMACSAPDTSGLFNQIDLQVVDGAAATTEAFVTLIDTAENELAIALPVGTDTVLTDAILQAHDRGVEVALVLDIDNQDDAGFAELIQAGVPHKLADDGLSYFEFNFNEDVGWSSDQTIMSSAFAIADRNTFISGTSAGGTAPGPRVLVSGTGEELVEDLWTEHNQLFGDADAVAVTAYDSPAKSIADNRWSYWMASGPQLELWFGPQERITKRMIDAVYRAKSSVWILTDDFANEGLVAAMQSKAEDDFDMRIVVGPKFGDSSSPLSRLLQQETPDVWKRAVSSGRVPTMVFIDVEPARNGLYYPAQVFVASHDLYSSARYYRADEVVTDQLVDGTLWVLNDPTHLTDELAELVALWDNTVAQVEGL
jgi:hypothetical protein